MSYKLFLVILKCSLIEGTESVFKTVVNLGVLYMCSKYSQNLLATFPVDIYCHK